jgi:hypothetical protein
MNPELEAILKAYDAAKQAVGPDQKHLLAIYKARLEELLQRHRGVSRATLEKTIQLAYRRWLKAQEKPSSLPPQA